MKVLVLSHMYPDSSNPVYGIFVQHQVEALRTRGIELKVVSPKPMTPFPVQYLRKRWKSQSKIPLEDTVDGIKVYYPRGIRLPYRFLPHLEGRFYFFLIRDLIRRIRKEFPFDLIHAHTVLPSGHFSMLLSGYLDVPFVVTIHGADLQKAIHFGRHCRNTIGKVIDSSSSVILVSNKLRRILHGVFPEVPSEKVRVVWNGVRPVESDRELDVSVREKRESLKGQRKSPLLLSVGNLCKEKGIEDVISILPRLCDTFDGLRYVIIGDGEQKNRLMDAAQRLGVADKVHFVGRLPQDETLAWMKHCDLFVLPSWMEGFGIVYIEAMSFGKTVIACQGEGIEDIVRDGVNGVLVRPKDGDHLFETVTGLLGEPERMEEIGRKARETVRNRLTWEGNAGQMIEIYKNILSSR